MVLLAQFSDIHLGPLPKVSVADLASKRLLGYLNWQRSRARVHADSVLSALVADMHAARPDQIVVTGDLVNLGLPAEYRTARAWLATLGAAHDVTVVPGNHDAYVASGVAHYTEQWRDFACGDGRTGGQSGFPFLRRRGPLALIGVSSAVPTAPFMATGRVGAAQAAALGLAAGGNRTRGPLPRRADPPSHRRTCGAAHAPPDRCRPCARGDRRARRRARSPRPQPPHQRDDRPRSATGRCRSSARRRPRSGRARTMPAAATTCSPSTGHPAPGALDDARARGDRGRHGRRRGWNAMLAVPGSQARDYTCIQA